MRLNVLQKVFALRCDAADHAIQHGRRSIRSGIRVTLNESLAKSILVLFINSRVLLDTIKIVVWLKTLQLIELFFDTFWWHCTIEVCKLVTILNDHSVICMCFHYCQAIHCARYEDFIIRGCITLVYKRLQHLLSLLVCHELGAGCVHGVLVVLKSKDLLFPQGPFTNRLIMSAFGGSQFASQGLANTETSSHVGTFVIKLLFVNLGKQRLGESKDHFTLIVIICCQVSRWCTVFRVIGLYRGFTRDWR